MTAAAAAMVGFNDNSVKKVVNRSSLTEGCGLELKPSILSGEK